MPVIPERVGTAELVFFRGDQSILHLRLDRAEVCIGSHATNDVVVPDPAVPDVAALLIDRGAWRYRLRDLTGGHLSVNHKPMDGDEIDLSDGDTIHIGPYDLSLKVRDGDSSSRPKHGRTQVLGQESGSAHDATITHQGKRYTISADKFFNIGGGEDNDLVIEDAFVSTFHCRVTCQNGRWFVSDLQSTNGTLVNGLRVREAELPTPATIKVGKALLTFEVRSKETAAIETTPPRDSTGKRPIHGMIAESDAMRRVFDLIGRIADAREPVLIMGESGCGKELVARAVHDSSARSSKPYLALNCSAFTSSLIESELFGHVKGAFTGAISDKEGAFEATDGGTLFLDEIGELPLELQPKLLRVLESSSVRRVGGNREIKVDTRIVAATHRNLEELVDAGEFREDLFHRLFVLSISIPPLRERAEDILPLAHHFLRSQAPERGPRLDDDAKERLLEYDWPGNIRELRNIIVRSILMTDGSVIRASDLVFSKTAFSTQARDARGSVRLIEGEERQKMIEALEKTEGNRAEAARILGVSKSTFHDRMRRYGIPSKTR
jgi:DNA-binding NtrC family response regulator